MRRVRIVSSAGYRPNGCPPASPYLLEVLHEGGLVADRLLLSEDSLVELVGEAVSLLRWDDVLGDPRAEVDLVRDAVAELATGG